MAAGHTGIIIQSNKLNTQKSYIFTNYRITFIIVLHPLKATCIYHTLLTQNHFINLEK